MGSCDVVEGWVVVMWWRGWMLEGVMNISCSCSLPHFQEDGIE